MIHIMLKENQKMNEEEINQMIESVDPMKHQLILIPQETLRDATSMSDTNKENLSAMDLTAMLEKLIKLKSLAEMQYKIVEIRAIREELKVSQIAFQKKIALNSMEMNKLMEQYNVQNYQNLQEEAEEILLTLEHTLKMLLQKDPMLKPEQKWKLPLLQVEKIFQINLMELEIVQNQIVDQSITMEQSINFITAQEIQVLNALQLELENTNKKKKAMLLVNIRTILEETEMPNHDYLQMIRANGPELMKQTVMEYLEQSIPMEILPKEYEKSVEECLPKDLFPYKWARMKLTQIKESNPNLVVLSLKNNTLAKELRATELKGRRMFEEMMKNEEKKTDCPNKYSNPIEYSQYMTMSSWLVTDQIRNLL